MSAFKRILNAIFTTLPAIGFGILEYISHDTDYFWRIYDITIAVFLAASLFLGFFLPVFLRKIRITSPWLNVIVPALLAYIIAGLALAVISITPLCIGQENGDGTNNLSQCIAVSGVVSLAFSPLELTMLTFSTFLGVAILSETPIPPMKLNFRVIVLVLLTITTLCAASIPLTGIISAATSYQGKCFGFTDGVRDCTFWEFARNEMDFMMILTFIPLAGLGGAWVVTAITWGINGLFASERVRATANWIGTAVFIILSLIFFPYVVLIIGGGLLSTIIGR
jgi:hypothetical protein